jgi:hypothetical protein
MDSAIYLILLVWRVSSSNADLFPEEVWTGNQLEDALHDWDRDIPVAEKLMPGLRRWRKDPRKKLRLPPTPASLRNPRSYLQPCKLSILYHASHSRKPAEPY